MEVQCSAAVGIPGGGVLQQLAEAVGVASPAASALGGPTADPRMEGRGGGGLFCAAMSVDGRVLVVEIIPRVSAATVPRRTFAPCCCTSGVKDSGADDWFRQQ